MAARPAPVQWAGSLLHFLLMVVTIPIWAVIALLLYPFPFSVRYPVIASWGHVVIRSAEWLCGLRAQVEGLEHISSSEVAVVMAKHQSAWETLALLRWFSPQTWVLKRELLYIPFFGWGLKRLEPIAIQRSAGGNARQQVLEQGILRLQAGRWVVVFPEGTRMPPGQRGRYRSGGASLAIAAGCPVIPVAHNAGEYWARRSLLRRPGTIRVIIGPPIATAGRRADDVTREVETWIEARMAEITRRGSPPPTRSAR